MSRGGIRNLGRREVLLALLGALGGATLGACREDAGTAPTSGSPTPEDWRAVFGPRAAAGAAAVGRAWLRTHPAEADPERLAASLCADCEATTATLRAALGRRHRADFERNRLERVGGWTLSDTECRLYALLALVQRDGAPATR